MQKQGANKRQKERARQDKQREKAVNRLERRKDKATSNKQNPEEDPDIAGIVPGPQAVVGD